VGWDRTLSDIAAARLMHPLIDVENASFTVNTATGHLVAAQHGAGPCLLACITGDRAPGIERWPTDQVIGTCPIWFVVQSGLAKLRRLQAFREFVLEAFDEEQAALEGETPINSPETGG
jgi:hypothetical protein